MRRVYIVAFMRKFLRPFILKSFFLTLFVGLGVSFVSVTNVMKNALAGSKGLNDVVVFILRAAYHAQLFVQILFVGIVFLLLWLCVDLLKEAVGRTHIHTHAPV